MPDHSTPGEGTSARLSARSGGLSRRVMADGGAVYTGDLAKQALRSVSARAMTVDGSIFVDDAFDISNPEDQALYAHESVHMDGSGGADAGQHGARDAEEISARAVERMVLNRAKSGEDFGAIMTDVKSGGSSPSAAGGADVHTAADPAKGEETDHAIRALMASGKSVEQIVKELTHYCVEQIQESKSNDGLRGQKGSNL
jgi:hypothetical protein